MSNRFAAIALAITILAAPAIAGAKESPTNDKGERLYCKNFTLTGSRMTKRVCKTAEEWQALRGEDELRGRDMGEAAAGKTRPVG